MASPRQRLELVDLAGAELPSPVDGRRTALLLCGEHLADWSASVYCEHHGEVWGYQSQRMVRTARRKYVYNPYDLDELYDVEQDASELRDLARLPECTDILRKMDARLIGWNDATTDMFQWNWVRWNFAEPVLPGAETLATVPLTLGKTGEKGEG